jgi:hypothetical protein
VDIREGSHQRSSGETVRRTLIPGRCSPIAQTCTHLRRAIDHAIVWRTVLQDLLTVKPLPRLQYVLADMSCDDMRHIATSLVARDTRLGRATKWHKLCETPTNYEDRPLKFLPGGRYLVAVRDKELVVHDYDDPSAVCSNRFLGPFDHPIVKFHAVPCSTDEVAVMVVTKCTNITTGAESVHSVVPRTPASSHWV